MDTVLVSSGFVLDQTEAPCPFNRRKPTWTTSVEPCHTPRNVEGPRPACGCSGSPIPKRTAAEIKGSPESGLYADCRDDQGTEFSLFQPPGAATPT